MAITCTSVDPSSKARIFDLTVPEGDAIGVPSVITWAGVGISDMDADPEVKFCVNRTPAASAPTGAANISIYAVTRAGFTAMKTAVAAGAVDQVYRCYMYSKLFFEF